jgi:hypothetical protein
MEAPLIVGVLGVSTLVLTTLIIVLSTFIEPQQPAAFEVRAEDETRHN